MMRWALVTCGMPLLSAWEGEFVVTPDAALEEGTPCDCGYCQDFSKVPGVDKSLHSWRQEQIGGNFVFPRPMVWSSTYPDCGQLLGFGGYGYVVDVKRNDGTRAAVKIQHKTVASSSELAMMRHFRGRPGVIDIAEDGEAVDSNGMENLVFSMDVADGSLTRCWSSTPETKLALFVEILRGISSVHAQGMVHRDVKPENVLIFGPCGDGRAALADLALVCKVGEPDCQTDHGTDIFYAPEYVSTLDNALTLPQSSQSNDLWAAGFVLFELVFSTWPPLIQKASDMPAAQRVHALRECIKNMPPFDTYGPQVGAEWSSSVLVMLRGLLEPDPTKRLNAKAAFVIASRERSPLVRKGKRASASRQGGNASESKEI